METRKANITLPADWHEAFRLAADAEGVTLSEWLRDCGAANLPANVRAKLSQPRAMGRPRVSQDNKPQT